MKSQVKAVVLDMGNTPFIQIDRFGTRVVTEDALRRYAPDTEIRAPLP